jgi:hypothetical protein
MRTSAAATRSCQVLPPRIAGITGIAVPPAASRGASAASGESAAGWEPEERDAQVVCRCACGSGEMSRRASSAATCSADLRVSTLKVVQISESAATCSADLRVSALRVVRTSESAATCSADLRVNALRVSALKESAPERRTSESAPGQTSESAP